MLVDELRRIGVPQEELNDKVQILKLFNRNLLEIILCRIKR
jgi:hypothetical protein